MSRIGISLEQVVMAAEQIQLNGENPTIEKIRAYIGGTGSNTTISKYLQEWRSKQQAVLISESTVLKCPPDSVNAAVKRVWQQIREETDVEIEAAKYTANVLIIAAEEKATAAEKETEKLHAIQVELQQQVHMQQAKIEIQLLDLKKQQEEHVLLQERYKGLEERYQSFQAITAKHQHDLVDTHKNEMQKLIEQSKSQESTYRKWLDELKNYNEVERQRHLVEVDTLKTQTQKQEQALAALQASIKLKDEELIELKNQCGFARKERDGYAEQIVKQEKKWDMFEKSNQFTDKLFLEWQESQKFDVNSCINQFNEIQSSLHLAMERLGNVTNEAKKSFELFHDKIIMNMTNE